MIDAGRLEVAWGPQRTETRVIDALLSEVGPVCAQPENLSLPLRVVVPSRSLRLHLAARIAERAGSAVLGLKIQTLSALALELLDRAGEAPPVSDAFGLVVREQARAETRLSDSLDFLSNGYAPVEAGVADLLDAGFEPIHAEAADERLLACESRGLSVAFARSILRVASRTAVVLREQGLGHRSDLLARASELLEEDPSALQARGVFVHGFSDATGRATELILTLLRHRSAVVILDAPLEPSALLTQSGEGPPRVFVDRFAERLSGVAQVNEPDTTLPTPPRVRSFSAVGHDGEVQEVAQRIQVLLRDGARPEAIGVVARDREPYIPWLRTHFARLGVSYSGLAPVVLGDALARRFAALAALLRQRQDCPTDRWLDARGDDPPRGFGEAERADLRLAFRQQGAGRLAEVAALREFPRGIDLPVRRGLSLESKPSGEEPATLHRKVAAEIVAAAQAAARQITERFARWPVRAPLADYVRRLRVLAQEDLGWTPNEEPGQSLNDVLDGLEEGPLSERELFFEDFTTFIERRLDAASRRALGGEGGGVQVLSVMEARARTFDHLFVLGLNRDVFPRSVREDALLPDALRQALADLLPDIPIKRRGYEEERHLFAQLIASSPEVTLSWQHASDDGRSRAASTLLERLRWVGEDFAGEAGSSSSPGSSAWLPSREHAYEAALAGGADGLAPLLPRVCEDRAEDLARSPGVRSDASELAASRLAVLREWDRAPVVGGGLGPFFGFVGSAVEAADPRVADVWVTGVEALASCPWQSFLERLLRIAPSPDPLGELPEVGALLRGSLVHRVLERLARHALAEAGREDEQPISLADLRSLSPAAWVWPGDEVVLRLLQQEAAVVLSEEGMPFSGLDAVLWRQAWIRLEVFRDLEWPELSSEIPLVGCEVEAGLQVAGRTVRFRADRVDQRDGTLFFTDYKVGRPLSIAAKESTRRKHLLQRVGRGELLQGVAYALAGNDERDVGRYLYLVPETEGRLLDVRALANDNDLTAAFETVVSGLLELRQAGGFAPRLVDAKGVQEPDRCGYCEVSAACLRGDSGSRRRLLRWSEGTESSGVSAEDALRKVWNVWKDLASGSSS